MKTLWQSNKPLTAVGTLLLAAAVFSLAGVFIDPRVITAMPAWMKPTKFALSTAVYALTLAWLFRYLPDWPRLRAITGWITAFVMFVEVALIDLQAARGTTSHFNVDKPFDSAIYTIMGTGIGIAWLASVAIAVALCRQKFADPVMGWALRIGMLITVLGAATGGLMTQPTDAQINEAELTHHFKIVGAHTVGAPDGGPGLPVTGWSSQHGDLRVPHFFGMHALQILPRLAWLWKPKRPLGIIAAGTVYGLVFILLLAEAIAGRPFLGGIS